LERKIMQRQRIGEVLVSCALLLSACERPSHPTEPAGDRSAKTGIVGGQRVLIKDLTGTSEDGKLYTEAITHVSVDSSVAAVDEICGEKAYVVCKGPGNVTVHVKWDRHVVAFPNWEKHTTGVALACVHNHNQGGGQ
jgi:hypothetical protein